MPQELSSFWKEEYPKGEVVGEILFETSFYLFPFFSFIILFNQKFS